MSTPGPRAGGPTPRRSFTPTQKLELLAQYEQACTSQEGGAFLREHGLYSSQITEWRKLRDAGVLAGKNPGEKIGKLTKDQAERALGADCPALPRERKKIVEWEEMVEHARNVPQVP